MTAIRIQGLTKMFDGFTALSDIDLDVAPGEFVTLLGPSGCGKTTLLKVISGFLEPTKGKIFIEGSDVTAIPPERRDTALCFQSYALFPHLTVRQNLEFGLRQKKISRPHRDERVNDVSQKLDLAAQMDKLPNQLSGGQQQRVSLGRALVMRPKVILFDEIRRIQRDYGLTAIYVTHDQSEALAMSDRVVLLNGGRIEQVDTPETLYHRPRTRFAADFIGNSNVFTGQVLGEDSPGRWKIETPAGIFTCAFNGTPQSKEVALCWRPEHAVIGETGIEARVLNRAFQGHFTDLACAAGNGEFRVQALETTARDGDVIRVHVPPDRIRLLEDRP
jgi:iron(III) transport system ATP-binding protein